MLTARGWWLLIPLLILLTVGLGTGTGPLILICFTLLGWLLGNWLTFAVKLRLLQNALTIDRQLRDDRGPVKGLWAGQKVHVVTRLLTRSMVSLPYARVIDRIPALGKHLEGASQTSGSLGSNLPLEISYQIECRAAGHLRFEGLLVQVADLQGFFQHNFFVRQVETYRILPMLAAMRGHLPTVKRFNTLPLLGTHRHRRPGSGGELLDLRDYLPGDPPKMIAWKASARRDRLMTKEFESEVPVRCTLFVDVSSSVRVGPPGQNVLARIIQIAAAVVQASAGVKDLTGLCLFEERGTRKMIRPARGPRHVLQVMAALANAADLPLLTEHVSLSQLVPLAYGLAQEVYPDLLDSDVNAFPMWLPWWSPQPGYTQEIPLLRTNKPWAKPWIWFRNQWRKTSHLRRQMFVGRFSGRQRRQYRWRKKLAALLAVRYRLGPGGLALLLEDDPMCRRYLQKFLAEHQVSFPMPMYDTQGRYLFSAPEKLNVLARGLLNCVARGRDNELFVLLTDLLEVGPRLEILLRAIQVARARHHRIVVICPWPQEVPLPTRDLSPSVPPAATSMQELFFQANKAHLQQAARHVQRELARLGVPVLFSPQEQAVSLILHQMNNLRLQERGGP
jgi:uncharacterized protein (DUF58 family)